MSTLENAAGVLVSLKPEFATAIAEGRKTIELRRRFPQVAPGNVLVVYVTRPVGAVVGIATIRRVQEAALSTIWTQHRATVALSRSRFDDYFSGLSRGYAVHIDQYQPIGPVALARMAELVPGFRAPQSWRYLEEDTLAKLRSEKPGRRSPRRAPRRSE